MSELLQPNSYLERPPKHDRFPRRPTFEDIREHKDELERALFWLPRKEGVERTFLKYKEELIAAGRTIEDDVREKARGERIFMESNPYPYDVADAEHHLLWLLGEDVTLEDANTHLSAWMEKRGLPDSHVVGYENNCKLKSVEARHFHVFARTDTVASIGSECSAVDSIVVQGTVARI